MTPLIQGEKATLTEEQQISISRWMAMKSMVAEYDDPRRRGIDNDEHHRFYSNRTLSPRWRIWIGHCDGATWKARYFHSGGFVIPIRNYLDGERQDTRPPNTQRTMIGLGRLILSSIYCSDDSATIEYPQPGFLETFPPTVRTLDWPGRPTMSDTEADTIAYGGIPIARTAMG
jgi:hypothetical protein